jgi:membrane protein
MTALRSRIRGVVAHGRRAVGGRDVTLWAAGLTFFAVLALVPVLLLYLRGAALLTGADTVVDQARRLGAALPAAHDPTPALVGLTRAAVTASWPMVLAALIPATMYGEGLRRGLTQAAGLPATRLTGWAGRLGLLPVLLVGPVLLAVPLAFVPVVGPLYEAGGWSTVLGVVVSFHVDLVPMTIVVAMVIASTGPPVLSGRAALLAGFCLGAVLTGFLHGFVLFLAIPIDWSVPFGGLTEVGVVAALALWLFALHVILLLGYRVALSTYRIHTAGGSAVEREGRDGRDDEQTGDGAGRPGTGELAGRGAGQAAGSTRLD